MYVIADSRVSDHCSARISGLGHVVIRLPCFWALDAPICAHPDLLVFPLDGKILTFRSYYLENRALFDSLPVRTVLTECDPVGGYPHDVALDALAMGDTLYGKRGAVDEGLRACFGRFVPVRQGYTRCSVLKVTERAAITADRGIADALERDGIAVLRIRPGYISLPGYNCGFIGGAAGDLGNGRIGFFGDFWRHPDAEAIEAFLRRFDREPILLEDGELTDRGGLCLLGGK